MNAYVLQFLSENADLPLVTADGVVVRFREGHGAEGWLEMDLVIGEDTGIDAIRLSWGLVRQWHERLSEYQARQGLRGDDAFYQDVWFCHERLKQPYEDIARTINETIGECFREYAAYESECEASKRRFGSRLDAYLWRSENDPSRLDHALDLMRLAGVEQWERWEYVRSGLARLAEGESPFRTDSPVSTRLIRERVRKWKDGRQLEG
jgi:hypothetical protein